MNQRSQRPIAPIGALALLGLGGLASALPQESCTTRRTSLSTLDTQGSGHSRRPSVSADHLFLAFESEAPDLVPGDTNGVSDVFLKDLVSGELFLVSQGLGGLPADGRSDHATISGNARFVVFESEATNLVPDDTNGVRDVFLYDHWMGTITRVSVSSAGVQGNAPSGIGGLDRGSHIDHNGNRVAFASNASNLVLGDTNGLSDVFVYQRPSGQVTRISVGPAGLQANGASQQPSLSANGARVAFITTATNLVTPDLGGHFDVLVVQLNTGALWRASQDSLGNQADGSSFGPSLSSDGRYVAYESFATNLVPGDGNGTMDVFVHDTSAGSTERVSVGWLGQEANSFAQSAWISGDGARVAFSSAATNLIPGGSTIQSVYVHDRIGGTTERWSESSAGQVGFGGAVEPFLTADGTRVAFTSAATLVPQDTNGVLDVYLRACAPTGSAYCHGSGNTCPCGNGGPGPGGCLHSGGAAGVLTATGTASVFADTITLRVSGVLPSVPILFFQGTGKVGNGAGVHFGDGLRCAGGAVVRLGTRFTDAAGSVEFGAAVSGDPSIAVRGQLPGGGGLRHYQGWYRDTAPFCRPEGFNLTNGFSIDWAP